MDVVCFGEGLLPAPPLALALALAFAFALAFTFTLAFALALALGPVGGALFLQILPEGPGLLFALLAPCFEGRAHFLAREAAVGGETLEQSNRLVVLVVAEVDDAIAE